MVQKYDDGGVGGTLNTFKPTLTAAQKNSIASYAGSTPNTSVSSMSAGPAPYIAPVQNYAGPQSNPYNTGPLLPQQAPPTQQQFAPPPPPAPPVGGRTWYNGLDQGAKAAQDQSWLGGDSDYTAQIAEYDKALRTFIDRIANQKKGFEQDANDATASTNRNQGLTLDQLGEDFGARGLSYSGLAVDSADKTNTRFNEAKGQIGKVLARNNQDADNRQADYQSENDISRLNAQKSSLSRQAQRQALLDSMAGF
jgi:hypothetical protein